MSSLALLIVVINAVTSVSVAVISVFKNVRFFVISLMRVLDEAQLFIDSGSQ